MEAAVPSSTCHQFALVLKGHSSEHSCTCKVTGKNTTPKVRLVPLSLVPKPVLHNVPLKARHAGWESTLKTDLLVGGTSYLRLSVYFRYALPDEQAQVPGKSLLVCHIQHFGEG